MARAERKIEASSTYRQANPRKLKAPQEEEISSFDPMERLNQAKTIRRSRRGKNA